jgi:hypothetical protein
VTPQRLLILKCSARKRGGAELIPAIERYDGPLWQVLRSFLRQQPLFAADLDVYVLSAAFGLIPASQAIPPYDQMMAPERADELRPAVLERFHALVGNGYRDLCLGLSQPYLRAMSDWKTLVPSGVAVTLTDGPMGMKLGQLRAWLEGRIWEPSDDPPNRLVAPERPRGSAQIAGIEIALSRDEVLEQARVAIAKGDIGSRRYRDWYVLVDGQPVAPKWLVSLISGAPTSTFDASAARRVLLALGIDIERAVSG